MKFESDFFMTGLKCGEKNGKKWYLVTYKVDKVYYSVFCSLDAYNYLSKVSLNASYLGKFNVSYDYKNKKFNLYLNEVL